MSNFNIVIIRDRQHSQIIPVIKKVLILLLPYNIFYNNCVLKSKSISIDWWCLLPIFCLMCCYVRSMLQWPSTLHLLKYGQHHLEGGPLARVFVHADADELGHMRTDAGRDRHAETLQRYLHAALHWR